MNRTRRIILAVGPIQTTHMTVLSVSIFTPNPDPTMPPITTASGCFVIPDGAFVVSSDLQHASVNVTVDASNLCPGFVVPVMGAVPIKLGAAEPPASRSRLRSRPHGRGLDPWALRRTRAGSFATPGGPKV